MKEENKVFHISIKLLLTVSVLIAVFGFLMAILKDNLFSTFINRLFNPVFWPNNTIDEGSIRFKHLVISLLGAMMTTWGILLYGVIKYALSKKKMWAWHIIFFSTLSWFIIDEYFSIAYQLWVNVLGNIPLFLMLLIPLSIIRKKMQKNS